VTDPRASRSLGARRISFSRYRRRVLSATVLVLVTTSCLCAVLAGAATGRGSARPPSVGLKGRPTRTGTLRGPRVTYQYSAGPVHQRFGQTLPGSDVTGFLSSPGGPDLFDSLGRVVTLHGVDAVYKHAPYELYPDPGRPWNFGPADAARIAKLGFNVVRLGIEWEGLEPGSGSPNSSAICRLGHPGDPHEFRASVARQYLANIAKTVDLLGHYGIYTLLDMHQDVYSRLFLGEGAPNWAVCTDNRPVVPVGGRWSQNYRNPTLDIAEQHFWVNDVVGNLQGQFDLAWRTVAHFFRDNRWIVGYDPYNEPFSQELTQIQRVAFATDLECFYTGRDNPPSVAGTSRRLSCPADDPTMGLIPTIEAADSHHLIFVEPDIYTENGLPALLEPMSFPRLVYNFHVYCPQRSPVTGNPTNVVACGDHEVASILRNEKERASLGSAQQPEGPAWFMSEFGATSSVDLVTVITKAADNTGVGWGYYSWKYYQDPTGSSSEALVTTAGGYSPIVGALSSTYSQAVAGTVRSESFNPLSGAFQMTYVPDFVSSPTSIFVAQSQHYPHGWCAAVLGGRITSAPGATHLLLGPLGHPSQITVTVTAGNCPSTS
jgi:endoglycosylceramidase